MSPRSGIVRRYANLPAGQQLVQRLVDEVNADEWKWERKNRPRWEGESHRRRKTRPTLRDMSFLQLLQADTDLAGVRREYALASAAHRRAAAQWEYDSAMVGNLFADAMDRIGKEGQSRSRFDPGVLALAIDPLFAPALLSVASLEYQHGHIRAAMENFLCLATLAPSEPDIVTIMDKAGDFLLDRKDFRSALRLYEAATQAQSGVPAYWTGISYCLSKLRRRTAAVAAARQAVTLDPSAARLNDLGWSLVQAGAYDEARSVLKKAVDAAPEGYDLPRNNLDELDRRIRRKRTDKKGLP